MGVKVKVMLPYDPTGKAGCKIIPADQITIRDPKGDDKDEEEIRTAPA